MTIDIPNGTLLIAFLLAMVRAGAWIAISPPFSNIPMPVMVKASVAAALGIIAMPYVQHSQIPQDLPGLIGALFLQVMIGSLLGLVTLTLFSALMAAGSMIDMFGGIVLPPSLDPLSQNQVPLIGQFYNLVAVAILFASGAYEFLLAGWVRTFAGTGVSLASLGTTAHLLTADLATFFVGALEIAVPVVVVLFAAQVVMGMIAKAAPQANVFLLAFPLQIGITLLFVGFGIEVLPTAVTNLVERAVGDMLKVVGL